MSRIVRLLLAAVLAVAGVTVASSGVVHASFDAVITYSFPTSPLTVGQSPLPVSLTISNGNTDVEAPLSNTICNASSTTPLCDPGSSGTANDRGINFIPSCAQVSSNACVVPDPGVFTVVPTAGQLLATGAGDCAGVDFTITVSDAAFGTLRFRHGAEASLAVLSAVTRVWVVDQIAELRTKHRYAGSSPAG